MNYKTSNVIQFPTHKRKAAERKRSRTNRARRGKGKK